MTVARDRGLTESRGSGRYPTTEPATEAHSMAEFRQYGHQGRVRVTITSSTGTVYVDYRDTDPLRRMLTPNGKIQARKRSGLNAREQRLASQAIKRARYMGLLPYTSATL